MWRKSFTISTSEVSREKAWQVLTDINNWNSWDPDLEWTRLETDLKVGGVFYLKPKGGPKTKMTILEMNQFDRFTDIAHLPLAKMFTTHVFRQKATELEVDVIIEVRGLLSFFWSKIIAQKQIDGGVAQMNLLFEKAKQI